jgi:hypothetical protein
MASNGNVTQIRKTRNPMGNNWKDDIHRKRAELAGMLHQPLAHLAAQLVPRWGDRKQLNKILQDHFASIPHVKYIYALDTAGTQVTDNIEATGVKPSYFGRDRSPRPYLREPVPEWGFLLSDAYISMSGRPSMTALHMVRSEERLLGYLGADFDLRFLPAVAQLHDESLSWRQIRGDPSIRSTVFMQCRVDSPMDQGIDQALSIIEDLMTERGMFQVVIHFSSSRATGWFMEDPYRYRIIDHEALADPDVCLLYKPHPYPAGASMPKVRIRPILAAMRELRMADQNIYLRSASINIFNDMVSLTFSCDGSHYMGSDEFLNRRGDFWVGIGG